MSELKELAEKIATRNLLDAYESTKDKPYEAEVLKCKECGAYFHEADKGRHFQETEHSSFERVRVSIEVRLRELEKEKN